MLKVIAGWLAPQMKRDAQAYDRMMLRLDEARWWLAARNPECSALAQFLIDKDAWYWSREAGRKDMAFCPPGWVTGIDSFRAWIETDPFKEPTTPTRVDGGE